jgi:hypothetical protein
MQMDMEIDDLRANGGELRAKTKVNSWRKAITVPADQQLHTALRVTLPTRYRRREPRRPWAAGFSFACAALAIAACAPVSRPAGSNVNLSGFPPEFRQGYSDGCASVRSKRVRDEKRFGSEPQYAAGWRDGFDICGKK